MFQTPSDFEPLLQPHTPADPLAFVFQQGKLLVREDDLSLPDSGMALTLHGVRSADLLPIGLWRGRYCGTTWVSPDQEALPGFAFVGLRALFGVMDESMLSLAGRAVQIAEWARTHRFCGHCGSPTQLAAGERAMRCPSCELSSYPRIAPAMMVLIQRPGQVLLARHTARAASGIYTALAGFLEPGETVEDAIHREVAEEVGLRVQNPRYFASQPWPFPHSLMLAFTADYAGGDIRVDESEITEAKWFDLAGPKPLLPPPFSVANRLILAHWPDQPG